MPTVTRGGPQHIPRPAGVRPGAAAPWADLAPGERQVDLEMLRDRIRNRSRPQEPASSRRLSAVLIPLYTHQDELHVILTRRAAHLRTHSHEVAFPGGGREPGDADLWETALRETHEEIGLDPAAAVPIGELDPFFTVGSDSLVHSYVAELPAGRPGGLRPDPAEVEKILQVPLRDLLEPDVYRQELWPRDGTMRPINFFEIPGDTIWGATAAILRQLLVIAVEPPAR
ncbi:MAG: CoA pyrophosphatase [bacterium]|nr:CoA pyrophosphatase [bacterium]